MTYDLSGLEHGLRTEKQLKINSMLRDYDPNLSLRRIPENDPAALGGRRFDPPRDYGVYEANVAPGQPNWVFTLNGAHVDERVLARVIANDLRRAGADTRIANREALHRAQQASKLKEQKDREDAAREQQLTIGKLAREKHTFRMNLAGRDVIIGDTIRPARQFITSAKG